MRKLFVVSILSALLFGLSFSTVFAIIDVQQPSTTTLTNPLGTTSIPSLIGRVINGALGVVGSLALLMFIYGGFTWMLSGGNAQSVEKGKNILIWAALGLVLIFTSYAIINFVISTAKGS